MALALTKIPVRRYLVALLCAWVVFFWTAAWALPPKNIGPPFAGLIAWTIVSIAVLLALATAVLTPIYFYQAWRRMSAVPNKLAYGVWMSFETTLVGTLIAWLLWSILGGR